MAYFLILKVLCWLCVSAGRGIQPLQGKDVLWALLHEKHMWATYFLDSASLGPPLPSLISLPPTFCEDNLRDARDLTKSPNALALQTPLRSSAPVSAATAVGARWLPMWLSQLSSSASVVPGNSQLFSCPCLALSLTVCLYKVLFSPTPTLVKPWPTNWFQSIFK